MKLRLAGVLCCLTIAVQAQTTTIQTVANAASFLPALSPGALAVIYGSNLGTSSTPVTVGGQVAAVTYASPTQFSIQIPTGLAPGSTKVQVGNSASFLITLLPYSPGLFFMPNGPATAQDSTGAAINSTNPAASGETVSFFATGLGATNPAVATGVPSPSNPVAVTAAIPTVTIGGVAATVVTSELAPNLVGVYQIMVRIPSSLTNGNQAVVLSISGSQSNTVQLPVGTAVADTAPKIGGVVSATGIPGSVQENIQSGSWVAIYGTNLAAETRDWSGEIVNGNLPQSLAGTSVTFNGKPAFVYFISPSQVNVQAPDGLSGTVQVVLTNNGQTSIAATANAVSYAPAFFQWGPAKYALITRYPDNAYIADPSLGAPYIAAKPGDVLILWATGFGPTGPNFTSGIENIGSHVVTGMVSVTVGGVPVTVVGAALSPGLAGVYQIAVQLPSTVPLGDDIIRASIEGATSPDNVFVYIAQ